MLLWFFYDNVPAAVCHLNSWVSVLVSHNFKVLINTSMSFRFYNDLKIENIPGV